MWRDNALRWDRTDRAHYEAWYLTLYDPKGERAFWLRYTILMPGGDAAHAEAGVWFFAFAPESGARPIARKRIRPLAELAAQTDPLAYKLPEGALEPGRTTGTLDGADGADRRRISWDLRFDECPTTYQHLHGTLRALKVSKATVCAPNLDTRFTGEVRIGDEVVKVEGWPGEQSHVWGKRYAPGWIWAHANAFPGPDRVLFEGISSRIPLGSRLSPPLTSLFFSKNGAETAFRGPRHLLGSRSALWLPKFGGFEGVPAGPEGLGAGPTNPADPEAAAQAGRADQRAVAALFPPGFAAIPEIEKMVVWFARATGLTRMLTAMIVARPSDMVAVEHLGPTGEQRFCYNTETASAILRLEGRLFPGVPWSCLGLWSGRHAASLELVLPRPIPDVPIDLPHRSGGVP
ncbi:MAG: hypothetical protein HZA54_05775 [Planctomycetes bacterium]|nr:hypothetical protein [Planctomycetota bacterium]